MLAISNYDQKYVDDCRAKINAQISAYRKLAKAATKAAGTKTAPMASALSSFEPVYFNGLVLILDSYFVHRTRAVEGKDGNPLNEVRVLCNSIMGNDGVLAPDTQIKLKPETSVLKHEVGDSIQLTERDFVALSKAFLNEIEHKYVA